jgi:hypothetical protein
MKSTPLSAPEAKMLGLIVAGSCLPGNKSLVVVSESAACPEMDTATHERTAIGLPARNKMLAEVRIFRCLGLF